MTECCLYIICADQEKHITLFDSSFRGNQEKYSAHIWRTNPDVAYYNLGVQNYPIPTRLYQQVIVNFNTISISLIALFM